MFWNKNEKLEVIKDLVGSRAAYIETVKMLELKGEEKDIFLRASIEVKKNKPNMEIIDKAYVILISISYQGDDGEEHPEDPSLVNMSTNINNNSILSVVKSAIGTSPLFMEFINKHNYTSTERTILSDVYKSLKKEPYDMNKVHSAYEIINKYAKNNAATAINQIKGKKTSIKSKSKIGHKNNAEEKINKEFYTKINTVNSSKSKSDSYASYAQGISDKITNNLGLEKIESFSLSTFFSEAFRKHNSDEVENLLSVGTAKTTPVPNVGMGIMPNPWIFLRAFIGAVIAYLIFLSAWNSYHNINLIPGLIIIGAFAVPFSVLILFFEINTPKNISIFKVMQFMVVGGSMSLFLSLLLFDMTSLTSYFGAAAAGFIEESGKLAVLLILIRFSKRNHYRYLLNALLLGAAVGTGFAAFESAGYALRIGFISSEVMMDNIPLRGAMSPFSHIIWTAIAAAAFWMARSHYTTIWHTLVSFRFLKIFLIPVFLHFVWNLPFEGPFMIKYIILGFVGWVVVVSLMQEGLKEILNIARDFNLDHRVESN